MKFEKLNICPQLKQNLNDMGLFRTTDIQYKSIPAIQRGEDVLAVAQTGTGKTAAFAIPIVDRIQQQSPKNRKKGVKCLILVPTRELAQQIGKVVSQLSRKISAKSFAVYGGVEQDPQIEQLKGGVDILIATPGRMFDLIHQGFITTDHVEILVLDEADQMLDMGFAEDIASVKRKLRQKHQTLFFSATINPKIKKLAYSQIRANALRIQVSPEKMISKNISHFLVPVEMDEKRHVLTKLLLQKSQFKYMVFVRTQVRVERVCRHLKKNGVSVFELHGGMEQSERKENLENFRNQESGILVATDISARGIDIGDVTHVINYDLPDIAENYVHRIGRTGRGFAQGEALSFFSAEEKQKKAAIEEFIEGKILSVSQEQIISNELTPAEVESMEVSEILEAVEAEFAPRSKKKK